MSLEETKAQLIHMLEQYDAKVIALSGKWGTGKSFMWDQIKKSDVAFAKDALYASVFGLSSIDLVKLKLIQSAAKSVDEFPVLTEGVKKTWGAISKMAEGFHKGFAAVNDIGLILAPVILREKLLVLDDIERKHKKLDVDEVLGFIDEMTKQYKCRVLLILNEDKLDKASGELWNTFREKVIDQELKLLTSSDEAFEIAKKTIETPYGEKLCELIRICGINNIRIIQKIIKASNLILGGRADLSPGTLNRALPSIVLLSAIHYRGIDDGPNFDFALDQGGPQDWDEWSKSQGEKSEEEKNRDRWRVLFRKLGISPQADEFELLVVEFLQSGLVESQKLSEAISRFESDAAITSANNDCNSLMSSLFWDYEVPEEQLLRRVNGIAERAHLLGPYVVSNLYDALMNFPGGEPYAQAALKNYIDNFDAASFSGSAPMAPFGGPLHPEIKKLFDGVEREVRRNTSAADVCEYLSEHQGWGDRQSLALRSATTEDFERLLLSLSSAKVRNFLWKMVELCAHKGNYEPHFGSAMDNFARACKRVIKENRQPRLSRIIKTLFKESNISNQLEDEDPVLDTGLD
ncbi:NTPase KAP [Herbaspirillum seropedicae]|uniref:KAP NTPase domain-containing protein n=1 Tax=Herbaspirillum seropedicae (strain SmR1) TaxID=757424 RepID=D8IYW6_HERSS|nr:hypothetical protein [Herbaspirillum seropedicae]ADJ64301.1 hypothetical protein Hsero_2808 [Herbaspirillum seropedicae SmR1]AKN66248.1 hypothetical protein ACP92_14080 [Herbaspirillum seropedicae]UMU22240.1 NTPase KAP [Herbaspirillum seropedicae]